MGMNVELLAPAGNYVSFLGALQAGADAIYLGGTKFGARAYAQNFTDEEVLDAIRVAHLHKRKIYLTVNTLLKNKELDTLCSYLNPFYEEGLDAVIVQDIGALQLMRTNFPDLPLHASTQMAITGGYGANLLKDMGVSRIVPARELSLVELRALKNETTLELETFIHGAMCYSYSGNCLFSSILGGRSGNRGRCAQPCRLPYQTEESIRAKETSPQFPLSLKDMCTLTILPKLMEAGIDSFKIEGRMKQPEYSAGVTALYRKYIDLYYALQAEDATKNWKIEDQDLDMIRSLYIRSNSRTGYYLQANGNDMITQRKSGYEKTPEHLREHIATEYLDTKPYISLSGSVTIQKNQPMVFYITDAQGRQSNSTYGMPELAKNQPTTEAMVTKQLRKTGKSPFSFTQLDITLEEGCFVLIKDLNELRRIALDDYQKMALRDTQRKRISTSQIIDREPSFTQKVPKLSVSVLSAMHGRTALQTKQVDRIYWNSNLFLEEGIARLIISTAEQTEHFMTLPYILRSSFYPTLKSLTRTLSSGYITGCLVRSLEELNWLKELKAQGIYSGKIILDSNLYVFNQKSASYWQQQGYELSVPYELTSKEWQGIPLSEMELNVYGNIPMMITANCVCNTTKGCLKRKKVEEAWQMITDRYQKKFPVFRNCYACYNVIYNSLPLSLHAQKDIWDAASVRLEFTTENEAQTQKILDFYIAQKNGSTEQPLYPFEEFTKGHYKRGVE